MKHRIAAFALIVISLTGCRRECSVSLVDEFPHAVFLEETWLIDFGSPENRRHLISGWSADEQWGEERASFVWAMGPSSVVRFERYGNSDVRLRFRCRPNELPGKGPQTVLVILNGAPLGTTTLRSEFGNYDLAVPASRVRIGSNTIEFRHGYWGPPPSSSVNDTRELAVAWDWIEIIERGNRPVERDASKEADAIVIPYRSALQYQIDVGPDGALVFDAIETERTISASDRGRVQMTVSGAGYSSAFEAIPDGKPRRFELQAAKAGRMRLNITVLQPETGPRSLTAVRLRQPRVVSSGSCGK